MSMELHFAPLQGYTDHVYRNAFQKVFAGVDYFHTPFIRTDKNETLRKKDTRDINASNNHLKLIIPQVLAGNTKEINTLLSCIESQGYHHADINLGCPFPMVVKSGRGSGLLAKPQIIEELLEEAIRFRNLKISIKVRLGIYEPNELLNLWPIFEKYPLNHVSIHARTTQQKYAGTPHLKHFNTIYEQSTLPLIYNGDLVTFDDIQKIKGQYPNLKGIMIGRGLLQQPFLASGLTCDTRIYENDRIQKLINFHELLKTGYSQQLEGESHLLTKMKTIWDYFLPELNKKFRKRIVKARDLKQYNVAVADSFQNITTSLI